MIVFIGGKMLDTEEGEAVLAELESRLIDSEARMREYDAVLTDREQELSLTHRVSSRHPDSSSNPNCYMFSFTFTKNS